MGRHVNMVVEKRLPRRCCGDKKAFCVLPELKHFAKRETSIAKFPYCMRKMTFQPGFSYIFGDHGSKTISLGAFPHAGLWPSGKFQQSQCIRGVALAC